MRRSIATSRHRGQTRVRPARLLWWELSRLAAFAFRKARSCSVHALGQLPERPRGSLPPQGLHVVENRDLRPQGRQIAEEVGVIAVAGQGGRQRGWTRSVDAPRAPILGNGLEVA